MNVEKIGCRGDRNGVGILLAQLGTPEAPTKQALRPYLKQFLSDPRVIEVNRLVWWFILNGIILNTRPARSAALYRRIWRADGSPLLRITEQQRDKLKSQLSAQGLSVAVEYGMRYGTPSLEQGLDSLMKQGCSRILLFPMYPQYAAATSASTYDIVFSHLLKRRWVPTLRVAEPYYGHPAYIQALAAVINEQLPRADSVDKLVLSYHGIPESYIDKGDPYCCMCTMTTERLLPQLRIGRANVIHTYQSRFGKDPWLVPYSDVTIKSLGEAGIKKLAVTCPGFTADCLETLDEMGNEASHLFKEHGGESLQLIPCLNDHDQWISAMSTIVQEELGSWLRPASDNCCECPIQRAKARGIMP